MNGSIRKSEPPESKYFRNSQCMSHMVIVEGCTSLFNVERCKDHVNQDDFMTCACCQHYDQYGFQRMKMNQIICYENVWLSSPDEINLTMETSLTQLVLGCWTNLGACWRAPFNVEAKSCSASSGCNINIEEAVWSKILFQLRWSVRLISSGVVVSCSLGRQLFIQFLATHASIHEEHDNAQHSTWKRFLF